jgi:tRNA G18 (ribose-2'-O)-methylase SpoU
MQVGYNDSMPEEDTRNVIDKYKGWSNEAIVEDLDAKRSRFHIAIENYQHDFNIGSIARNANAFNVAGVHVIGKKRWNRRGAMVTDRYMHVYHHEDVEAFRKWANEQKLRIVGIDNIQTSTPLHKSELPENAVYLFGQEGPGLSSEAQEVCESIIAIEQFGSTRSVNVGVASGIIMYEWARRNILTK